MQFILTQRPLPEHSRRRWASLDPVGMSAVARPAKHVRCEQSSILSIARSLAAPHPDHSLKA